ncbi:ABC-ATPase domain-containing protein [Pyrodictium abyssi]|uniref:ABC-ATPase domain-containing protein n=1 Tax=Pyrodictium abyssi TaxID=54256 RepID=A0ABN6ZLK2_9CREN|nr:ABC-ATPase domain-containing protein [Pyrodictium abyssi]
MVASRARSASISGVLRRIDGRGYKAYRMLLGASERVGRLRLSVVRVQGDPFAPPSVVKATARLELPGWALRHPVAVADYIYRRLYRALQRHSARLGEGRSGFLGVPRPGPVMLRRSGVELDKSGLLVVRVWAGLPSRRRRVLGDAAEELLLERLPRAVEDAIRVDESSLRRHVDAWRLQEEVRSRLPGLGLVSFIGDGSILPRRCGGCDDPLPGAVPFESPPSLRVEVETSLGIVTGMGIRRGVTVIAGTAFHGKTTLLEAIQYGVYNHVPGDGRERVVTIREAVKVHAEDGRSIACVDVSTFVHSLPGGRDTRCFTTRDASGATSMAAAIQEAVEAGAKLILIDEDTSATNLLFYDERAAPLLRRKTVTTIAEQAASMASKGVSLVIVSSGSMPLIASADTVIVMEDYIPRDATDEARRLASRTSYAGYSLPADRVLVDVPRLAKPRLRGSWLVAKGLEEPLNLESNEQLVEEGQLRLLVALASRLESVKGMLMRDIVRRIDQDAGEGFQRLTGGEPGPGYAEVRGIDVVYMVNRIPGIRVHQAQKHVNE